MVSKLDTARLLKKSGEIRLQILEAIRTAKKGHIGGAYSIVDFLVALYFGSPLKFKPDDPNWSSRDRVLLSKGHAGVALYAVLSDLGFFPKEEMRKLNNGALLGEHPDQLIPGVEVLSGSLGHGLSIGAGMAFSDKSKKNDRKTFVILGDGECYEGSIWEAANFSSHHKLGNLCVVVDRNTLITHGSTEQINELEPFGDKWRAFGWNVMDVKGHDLQEIINALDLVFKSQINKPTALILETIKGKGVSFMENEASWHHGNIDEQKFVAAKHELVRHGG